MERKCKVTGQDFTIHPDEEAFLKKITFKFGEAVVNPPLPVYHPDVRMQRRTCHRNERTMYKTQSAFSGKDIVSLYHADSPFTVYSEDEWRSDKWDPLDYGQDFDFEKPFFEQFYELMVAVPRLALITVSNENSGFTTGTGYCKNCYLINSSEYCEDCYYSKLLQHCKDCCDCSYVYNSELLYECYSVYDSYNCQYVSFSSNCTDCLFSSNLNGCTNCCLCTNLHKKEYYFLNEPLSKEEYEKRIKEFKGSYKTTQQMKQKYLEIMKQMVRKYSNITQCQNCTGDYLENSKNCFDCYDVNESEDCRYVQVGVQVKDCYDCSNMYIKPELCYETLGTIEVFNCAYCIFVFHSQNLLYCDYCFNCKNCFGCTGLTRKEHCIFNKQYTKEEYEVLVPKIIEHMKKTEEWGQFFPPQFSPFGYNESLAYEYFPLTETQAKTAGFAWRAEDTKDFMPQTATLPDHIKDATDDLTQEVFACEVTKKNYRIIPQELEFYRQQQIPLPRRHPDQRHLDRMTLRQPRQIHSRSCVQCHKTVSSTYAPNQSEKIYCEDCYLKHVY